MEAKYRELQAQGCDVVPGLAGAHGDRGTVALLGGLAIDPGAFAGLLQLGRSGLGQKRRR